MDPKVANPADKNLTDDASMSQATTTAEKTRPFSRLISTEMQTRALSDKVLKIECILDGMKQAVDN